MQSLPRSTPTLRLRHFVPEDVARIMALNAESSTRLWLPSHVYPTLEDADSALAYLISCYKNPGHPQQGPYVLAVEQLSSCRLLGHVGFSPFGSGVEVSYAIAEAFRGHGYGTEALVHACHWVAETFKLKQVLALTASANGPSRRLLERASFVHAEDSVMTFQGQEMSVSRYSWTVRTGGCLCGAVQYTVSGEPLTTRICWCRTCQKIAGNGTANAIFPSPAIEVTGAMACYASTADSGNQISRHFCAVCGSHLFASSSARPQFRVLRIGTLDDPSSVQPEINMWSSSAPTWACLDANLKVEERQAPPLQATAPKSRP